MDRMIMHLGGKSLGAGQPVFVVFEAGPTHTGLETAKQLVDVAVGAGADAVKFQIGNPSRLISSREVMFTYGWLADRETGRIEQVTEPLLDILRRREMPWEHWRELVAYCRDKGIIFFSTVSDEERIPLLAELGLETVKICSGDINHHSLLRKVAGYDWSVQVDTGSSTIGEVEAAVDVLGRAGCREIIINHCPSGYPARLDGVNLRVLTTLQQMFPYPVAFSDHTPGCDMDLAAVALGADMIEKTITLDRTTRGPEHVMSLEPHEAADFVRRIRDLEQALGDPRRLLSPEEDSRRLLVRRSLFAARDLAAGETLAREDLEYSRPGDGIPAHLDELVLGRTLARDVAKGEKLAHGDFR